MNIVIVFKKWTSTERFTNADKWVMTMVPLLSGARMDPFILFLQTLKTKCLPDWRHKAFLLARGLSS